MIHRLTARVLLACYGIVALWGQGLHEFLDEDCGRVENSALADAGSAQFVNQATCVDRSIAVHAPSGDHVHDCDNCPICQFQTIGQHFVAPPPSENGIAVCGILYPGKVESVYCPAHFSPEQPRAPPIA
jgi:hypothetical protein